MKYLFLLPLLLLGCGDDDTYFARPPEEPAPYVITLEVSECDGVLAVEFGGLQHGSMTLLASSAETRRISGTRNEWQAVVRFGEEN